MTVIKEIMTLFSVFKISIYLETETKHNLVFIFQISLGVQRIQTLDNLGSITLPSSLLTNLPTEDLEVASRIIFNFFKKTTVFQVFFGPLFIRILNLNLSSACSTK